ncbi:MAG TPA: hydroxyethylthiazole kinase [Pseudogracilibacillus sp.]|nr:hydroxyethylthiazole kinase [Pseudogracilibacillus sp.]
MATTIELVRKNVPLIHHLTNQVVMNFTANGLLAFGGSPIMSKEPKEAETMAQIANGVLINIGTVTEKEVEAMFIAGKTASELKKPVILDPVGVAASSFRQQVVRDLIDHIPFTAIKGNAGEMAHLVDITWQTKGVESIDDDNEKLSTIAKEVATRYGTLAIVTGEVDVLCDGKRMRTNGTGHPYLTKITGAGCLLGSIVTACLTANDDHFQAAFDGVSFYGEAAEIAVKEQTVKGTGTFIASFLDALATT